METIKKYFWQLLVLGLVILLFLQNSCNNKKIDNSDVIITPPKQGEFNTSKPISIKVPEYIYQDNTDTIKLENPLNKKLEAEYKQALKEKDSLKLKLLYLESIQIRKYHEKYEDKNILIDIFANTTGTLDSIGVKYKTKSDTIPIKKTVFKLSAGPSLEFNPNTFKMDLGVNGAIENKKGNIFIFGANTNKDLKVGYLQNLWEIKK